MRFLIAAFAAFFVSACATIFGDGPRDSWDKQQALYNSIAEEVIDLRAPCVEIGPEAPTCLLDDEAYGKVLQLQNAADGYLKAADEALIAAEAFLAAGDDSAADDRFATARRFLGAVEAALAAILVHTSTEAS